MRIIHSIAGTRLDHGGTSRSVPALCDSLLQLGADVQFVSAWPADRSVSCNYPKDASRVHLAAGQPPLRLLKLNGEFKSLLRQLIDTPRDTIVHDHGVWLASNHAVAAYCRTNGVRRIVSPRGMLGAWALSNGRWKKWLAWHLYQRRDLASAVGFHTTSQQEADEVRALGFEQPVVIVANGIRFPKEWPKKVADGKSKALFLSRVHPKKGLLMLVEAWARVKPLEWDLVIAGPDENDHQAEVVAHAKKMGIAEHVQFPGVVSDAEKWQVYANSDLFILPSFNENYGLVIAEAMAAGLPVITTTGTPWSVLKDQGMGWWEAPTVEALSRSISQATSVSEESRNQMGAKAAAWARAHCGWTGAAQQMLAFYHWLSDSSTHKSASGFVLASNSLSAVVH